MCRKNVKSRSPVIQRLKELIVKGRGVDGELPADLAESLMPPPSDDEETTSDEQADVSEESSDSGRKSEAGLLPAHSDQALPDAPAALQPVGSPGGAMGLATQPSLAALDDVPLQSAVPPREAPDLSEQQRKAAQLGPAPPLVPAAGCLAWPAHASQCTQRAGRTPACAYTCVMWYPRPQRPRMRPRCQPSS